MRLKNIKNAHDIIEASEYLTKDITFNNSNPIHIEIGMGKGDFIINKALQNPGINYVGIEKYASILVSVTKKLNELNLSNLKIINDDANEIEKYFNKNVEKIYLNFSDPWPKKRHHKRRLTSYIFLNKYKNVFKDKYLIEMKTDNSILFEYSLSSLSMNGYILNEVYLDLYKNLNKDNIATEYEKKFVSYGNNIYKLVATGNFVK